MGDIDTKIAEMQEFMAHQAKEIADLNEVVTRQGTEIDTLKKYFDDLIFCILSHISLQNHEFYFF